MNLSNRQSFGDAVEEFVQRTDQTLGIESAEDRAPPLPSPVSQNGERIPSMLILTEELIRRYALSIGDDNPLFTDPAYGNGSVYGSLIAPGPILVHVRYPADHGGTRAEGYPVANYLAGVAWEFYNVLRPGTRFTSSKIPREHYERHGSRGRLLILGSENSYWDQTGAMIGRAYGSLIHVPMESMADGRAMDIENLGRELLYRRAAHRYTPEEIERFVAALAGEGRRGANARYWEDVTVGDVLPEIHYPPYTVEDEIAYHALHQGMFASTDRTRWQRAFGPIYRRGRREPGAVRLHPKTMWPYTRADEHEDAFLAPYRGAPMPFDFGIQRVQTPHRLLANWMGDAGFIRKFYIALRRPVFYGDVVVLRGIVTARRQVIEGNTSYKAVTVAITGINQLGEAHCEGFATVYLPSREDGPPVLPIPHERKPAYVPLAIHRSEAWYR